MVGIFFTEGKLCYIYLHFGYPFDSKLYKLLTQASYDIKYKIIKKMSQLYYYCLIKSKNRQQFRFILKKNIEFNYKIVMDILYIDIKPILHTINITTTFSIGRFFNNISIKHI